MLQLRYSTQNDVQDLSSKATGKNFGIILLHALYRFR